MSHDTYIDPRMIGRAIDPAAVGRAVDASSVGRAIDLQTLAHYIVQEVRSTGMLHELADLLKQPADKPVASSSPIMDFVRAQPGLAHVEGADADLMRRLLTSRAWHTTGRPVAYRWQRVSHSTGHGSEVSRAICQAIGFDPDELVYEH